MKKILIVMFAAALATTTVACGKKKTPAGPMKGSGSAEMKKEEPKGSDAPAPEGGGMKE
jgi:hypothetical protein